MEYFCGEVEKIMAGAEPPRKRPQWLRLDRQIRALVGKRADNHPDTRDTWTYLRGLAHMTSM